VIENVAEGIVHSASEVVVVEVDVQYSTMGSAAIIKVWHDGDAVDHARPETKGVGMRPTACASVAAEGARHGMASKSLRSRALKAGNCRRVLAGAPATACSVSSGPPDE
jgi:hypothetical protein